MLSVNSINHSILSSHDPDFPVAPPNQPSEGLNPLKTKSLGGYHRSLLDDDQAVFYTDNGDKIHDLGTKEFSILNN